MKKFFLTIVIVILFQTIFAFAVLAQNPPGGNPPGGNPQPVSLTNPLATKDNPNPTPQTLIGKVINAVLGIVGSIALVMFIYGGFTWMTAAGNEQSVTKGKDILIWATVGLIVIFSAYALVKFVFKGIGATGG